MLVPHNSLTVAIEGKKQSEGGWEGWIWEDEGKRRLVKKKKKEEEEVKHPSVFPSTSSALGQIRM